MSSLKIILRKKVANKDDLDKQKKDTLYPLAIRITKDRVSSFTFIGHKIAEKFWDEKSQTVRKSHPNSKRLNNLLKTKMAEASNKLLDLEVEKNDVSSRAIKSGITSAKHATFFKQANIYLDNLRKQGKFNRISADTPRVKHFRDFLKGSDITFTEINVSVLKQYYAYLKGHRKISDRTAVNHLVMVRTIFNQAIAANIADRKYYPFGKGKIVIKFPESVKIGLTSEEVKAIEALDIEQKTVNHARNVWLFSFYFAGMRISDVLRLKWSDFQDNRLTYAMGKNAKVGSLKVPEKALHILKQYRRLGAIHDLVFPDLESLPDINDLYEVQRRINQRVKNINDSLKDVAKLAGITKKLTNHIGRHTFGNISGDKISLQMLQKLYRHTSITTTIGYQANFIHKDADEALDAVIGF